MAENYIIWAAWASAQFQAHCRWQSISWNLTWSAYLLALQLAKNEIETSAQTGLQGLPARRQHCWGVSQSLLLETGQPGFQGLLYNMTLSSRFYPVSLSSLPINWAQWYLGFSPVMRIKWKKCLLTTLYMVSVKGGSIIILLVAICWVVCQG